MKRSLNFWSALALLLQALILSAFTVGIVLPLYSDFSVASLFSMMPVLPAYSIVLFSFILHLYMKAKTKGFSRELLLSLLFVLISISAVSSLPFFNDALGFWILSPNTIAFISRVSVMSVALVFVFSALSLFGMNQSKLPFCLGVSAFALCFLSYKMPFNTLNGNWKALYFSSFYDGCFALVIGIFGATSVIINLGSVLKASSSQSIVRALGSILLSVGFFMVFGFSVETIEIAGAAVFLLGSLLFAVSSNLESGLW